MDRLKRGNCFLVSLFFAHKQIVLYLNYIGHCQNCQKMPHIFLLCSIVLKGDVLNNKQESYP